MAISINDRQLITQFITNTQNLNVNLPTNGGGCANLVRGIIEQATGKRIYRLFCRMRGACQGDGIQCKSISGRSDHGSPSL